MQTDVHSFLATTCYLLLGVILMLYVITDGFDLGVGILSLFEREEGRRTEMMAVINGVWDANETWLVLFGVALFGAFPVVYTVMLHALYIPLGMMLLALILRGVAVVIREHARSQRLWSLAFGGGSLVAALAQGYALGGIIGGLPVADGEFTGSAWSWLSPFSTVVAVGVAAGYALLGGGYLIIRTRGGLQSASRRRSRYAAWIMLFAAAAVTSVTPVLYHYCVATLVHGSGSVPSGAAAGGRPGSFHKADAGVESRRRSFALCLESDYIRHIVCRAGR